MSPRAYADMLTLIKQKLQDTTAAAEFPRFQLQIISDDPNWEE